MVFTKEMQPACAGISSSQKSRHSRHRHSHQQQRKAYIQQITHEQAVLRQQSQQQELEIIRLQVFN